ncbi:reverse transcriptase domain-containing protein [Tanacetum coccineum]|uniref:Reverse transcriptase domain-containing protein n=1 Tax=Tanacetum coccineum TaxID=301880 RepID=A0ABQ4WI76_9ASTR
MLKGLIWRKKDCEADDVTGHCLSYFPDSFTSLESLDISSLSFEVSFSPLERLVAHAPNLRKLRLLTLSDPYSDATHFGGVIDSYLEPMLKRTRKGHQKNRATPLKSLWNDAQLKALIDQGVVDALAERDTDRSRNGDEERVSSYSLRLKIESIFHINNCTVACQIKFAICTLQGNALTWWNSHVKTVTHEVAYAIPWLIGIEIVDDRSKSDEIEKYVSGLPDMIHRSVMTLKPKTMQDAIEFATELIDKKISTIANVKLENKRD